jgi:hypothetical protein
MRLSAGFTFVLVGAATVASAQPGPDETTERIRYGDHGNTRRDTNADDWVQLATPTPASHGTEFIVVGKEQGAFAQLRIDADGKVMVRRVKIYFDDDKQQTVVLERNLGDKRRSVTIPLVSPQEIDRVVVTTDSSSKGSYSVYGSSTAGVAAR